MLIITAPGSRFDTYRPVLFAVYQKTRPPWNFERNSRQYRRVHPVSRAPQSAMTVTYRRACACQLLWGSFDIIVTFISEKQRGAGDISTFRQKNWRIYQCSPNVIKRRLFEVPCVAIRFKGTDNEIVIALHDVAYLCNDAGKTIERLGPAAPRTDRKDLRSYPQ